MSIFATVAIVCTMSACNHYHIDKANDAIDGVTNTVAKQTEFNQVWEDEKGLTDWLSKYEIGETVFEIVSLDLETQEIQDNEIP